MSFAIRFCGIWYYFSNWISITLKLLKDNEDRWSYVVWYRFHYLAFVVHIFIFKIWIWILFLFFKRVQSELFLLLAEVLAQNSVIMYVSVGTPPYFCVEHLWNSVYIAFSSGKSSLSMKYQIWIVPISCRSLI